ncbi:type I restriction-modification system subunit M N-terminal domain-containing protein [Pandoraea eparura]|uniref:type I restriction-modification system subunit M N-terminal domain-containing protein n=1 Tax=Pandoraea eparura TaxID=2508291 RepID=UPI003CCD3428
MTSAQIWHWAVLPRSSGWPWPLSFYFCRLWKTGGITTRGELESYLDKAAGVLRGNADHSEFRGYVFALLFYKRISDCFDEEVRTQVATLTRAGVGIIAFIHVTPLPIMSVIIPDVACHRSRKRGAAVPSTLS